MFLWFKRKKESEILKNPPNQGSSAKKEPIIIQVVLKK